MKKLLCCLVISSFVLPILIPSTVFAFGGPHPTYGFQDRERYRMGDQNAAHPQLDAEQMYLRRFEMNHGSRFSNDDAPGNDPRFTPPGMPNAGENAPIDGGLSLLLAAGLGLGVKKAIGRKKALQQENNDTEK